MILPNSWNDDSLLKHEPFLSVFVAWKVGRTNRTHELSRVESLVQQVLDSSDFAATAHRWLQLAFAKHKENEPAHPHLDKSSVQIFVEFYWRLSLSTSSASNFIGKKRREAGFYYQLPVPFKGEPVIISSTALQALEKVPSQNPSGEETRQRHIPKEVVKSSKPLKRPASLKLRGGRPTKLVAVESANDTQSLKIKKEIVTDALQKAPESKLKVHEGNIKKRTKRPKKKKSVILSLPNCSGNTSGNTFALDVDIKPPLFPSPEESNPVELATEDPPSIPMKIDSPRIMLVDLPPIIPVMAPPVENNILTLLENTLPQHVVKDEHSELITAPVPVTPDQPVNFSLYTFKEDDMNLAADFGMPPLPDNKLITVPLTVKPRLPMYPPIWAQSRQEVCESFDWFRSYQSGVYHAHGVVKGYLLSAFSSKRDIFEDNGKLIISHGGGKAESLHTRSGQTTTEQADDQLAQDKSVRALLRNYRESRPIVLLIDDKYALFPYDLAAKNVAYAVLGFYVIAYAWAEYQPANNERGRVIRYKFAFQWCDGQGEPWWTSTPVISSPRPEPTRLEPTIISMSLESAQSLSRLEPQRAPVKLDEYNLGKIRQAVSESLFFACGHCQEGSPQIYLQNWTCLNAACLAFWTTHNGRPFPENLTYDPRFLQLSKPFVLPRGFEQLEPPQPAFAAGNTAITNYAFSRGWHCRNCGRLSCRYKWEHWECMNCKNVLEISGKIRAPNEFWNQAVPANYKDHFIARTSGVVQEQSRCFSHGKGFGQTQTFILPEGRGFIHHIQPGTPLGRVDADIIFREYQEQASNGSLAFRRWPLRSHKCRGPLLTNYFSQNAGEPYQYVGGTANTVPFDQAPSAVVKARELIQTRVLQALNREVVFNEVLSAAYMERQKMAFHNDNEIGLGPLVAGLSLGSPALMHFRLHAKHDPNREHKGILMSFVLRHGDVLVMDGPGVQEYYEHTVVPSNFRVAATARFINPNHPQQIRTKLT